VETSNTALPLGTVTRAYAAVAPVYDWVFGWLLHRGRARAIQVLQLQPGHRVLEIGVGTGISLPLYPREVRIHGVDISRDMLEKAKRRVARHRLTNVESLRVMDAHALEYPEATFDAVVAMYTITVVDDPWRVANEMRRVCKPKGRMVFVNHFRATTWYHALWDRVARPAHRAVHCRADLDMSEFLQRTGLRPIVCQRVNIFGYSTLLCCLNE
jgi:phosphatidylethanolamine/phosphatidyl-N-methylethanolamine N-methyltransferase